jgi:hypothetical protein
MDIRIHDYSPISQTIEPHVHDDHGTGDNGDETETDVDDEDDVADTDIQDPPSVVRFLVNSDRAVPVIAPVVAPMIPPTIPPLNLSQISAFIQQLQNHVPHTPPTLYHEQITQMRDFGFTNMELVLTSLNIAQGDVNEAVSIYISMSET